MPGMDFDALIASQAQNLRSTVVGLTPVTIPDIVITDKRENHTTLTHAVRFAHTHVSLSTSGRHWQQLGLLQQLSSGWWVCDSVLALSTC